MGYETSHHIDVKPLVCFTSVRPNTTLHPA